MGLKKLLTHQQFQWFDLEKPQSQDLIDLAQTRPISFLLLQDTLRPEHLPKYENDKGTHFFILRFFDPSANEEGTTVQEMTRKFSLFVHQNQLISIHRSSYAPVTKKIPQEIDGENYPTLRHLLHQILQTIIRSFEEPLEKLDQIYDEFEEKILTKENKSLDLTKVYQFRRRMFILKKVLKVTQDSLSRSKDFWSEQETLLQDLKENINQIYFDIDDLSQNFEHLFQVHISLNENKANEVMKILTTFSTILLPLNFIASFFGMNFSELPGINSKFFLWAIILIMNIITLVLFLFFRKKRWF